MPSDESQGREDSRTMNEITRNNKNFQEEDRTNTINMSDIPVEILSVPTKMEDGNADLHCAANDKTAPSSFADVLRYDNYYGGVDISPMPATPTLATISRMSLHTPSSQQSMDTLKTLYHSSRRSRHESPSPMPVLGGTTTNNLSKRHGFPPPPPLASASPKIAKHSGIQNQTAYSTQGNVSYHSTGTVSASSLLFHNSWDTSMAFFPDFIEAPPLYHSGGEERQDQGAEAYSAAAAGAPRVTSSHASLLTPLVPTKPTLSTSQFEYTPNTTMDRQLLDLANESSANMCMEQFAKFSTSSVSEFENQEDNINQRDDLGKRGYGMTSSPRKKQKGEGVSSNMVELHQVLPGSDAVMHSSAPPDATKPSFDQTPNSCRTNLSIDISAHPTNEISPLNDGIQESIQCLLALSNARPPLQNRDRAHDVEHETHHILGQTEDQQDLAVSRKRDLDIIQRKVRRLLLIRHATRCKVPLPPSTSDACDSSAYVCPASSHCAEGKRLASHVRKCKDTNCEYKWCLTTRDVLGHYRSCRDRKCQICGPVRAMHVYDAKVEEQKEDQEAFSLSQRSKSENSMETIEDKEWLNANMT
ncbi:hypothetical protein ACHAW6_011695 [Cyclotella cf. meneghiniana]